MESNNYLGFGKDKREKFNIYNSLVVIPHMLLNRNTIIDLRNDTSVAGTINCVDGYILINKNLTPNF